VHEPLTIARRLAAATLIIASAAAAGAQALPTPLETRRPVTLAATRGAPSELRAVDQAIDGMIRDRTLVLRDVQRDALVPERVHERLDRYVRGVRIIGGDLTRQTAPDGTVSIFGTLHPDLAIDVTPAIAGDDAAAAIAKASAGEATGPAPELVILPLSDGYHLAYRGQAVVGLEIMNVFVDANSGALLQVYSDFIREVGTGKGAYGDVKKVSAKSLSGTFVADDPLRPAAVTTYDMKGNLSRTMNVVNRVTSLAPTDIAADADNDWSDPTVVDAHVYAGWYYDFIFKRFGRHGLDNRDLRMPMITHPVRAQDIATASSSVIGLYYFNAFFCTTCLTDQRGAMVFGEGAARGAFFANVEVKPFSAAIDVVAHELTHGVTANSARLNGFPFSEAGALNEAFSDIFGVATSFFYQPPGNAALQASYLVGKDLAVPSGAILTRSISNPASTNDPDHYLQRILGGDPHYNSTIVSHAFYLAIEGGTNRTSGRAVQGVGAANRDQIEKAFFRALTVLMPSSSNFATANVTTIQAARDLYGAGSAAERAIIQAWDAVGVQERTTPAATMMPNPATVSTSCSTTAPWLLSITVSAGTSNLRITQWEFDLYDAAGNQIERGLASAATYASFAGFCGPASATITAQTDSCLALCTDAGGRPTGSAQSVFTALDDAGRTVTFSTPRVTLASR
jgi:Zn-dependent metalloprotease